MQSKSGTQTSATTSLTVTLTGTPVTGNKLIVAAVTDNAGAVTFTAVDGNSNALTVLSSINPSPNGQVSVALLAYDVPATPSSAITVTRSANTSTPIQKVLIQEISGLLAGNTTAMLDGTVQTSSGGTTTYTAPTYTSTALNEFLACVYGDNGGPTTYAQANSYLADVNGVNSDNNDDIVIAYKNSTNGAETAAYTLSGTAAGWASITACFKLAVGGVAFLAPVDVRPNQAVKRGGYW